MTIEVAQLILWSAASLIGILIICILIQKAAYQRYVFKQGAARDYLFDKYFDQKPVEGNFSARYFMDAYIDIETQVQIEPDIRKQVVTDLSMTRFYKKQLKKLNSISKLKRKQAIFYVGSLSLEEGIYALSTRLQIEKNDAIKFYLIYYLREHMDQETLHHVLEAIKTLSEGFQKKVYGLIDQRYQTIKAVLYQYLKHDELSIRKLIIYVAKRHHDPILKTYLIECYTRTDDALELRRLAFDAYAHLYPEEAAKVGQFDDLHMEQASIIASSEVLTKEMLYQQIKRMDGSANDEIRIKAISRMVYTSKSLLLSVLEYYPKTSSMHERKAIAIVLAHRIEYIVLKLKVDAYHYVKNIIKDILDLHIIEDFIDFLNRNKDLDIQKVLLGILKPHLIKDHYILEQASIYLSQNILNELGLMKKPMPLIAREKTPIEKSKIYWLIRWIIIAFLIFPVLFLILNFRAVFFEQSNLLILFVLSVNRYLVIYFLTVNSIYMILLLISLYGAHETQLLWHMKRQTLLFEAEVLPSISIIAPAYNEEKSIIESVTSLLNLKYPNYEVIVVNDGSKDHTIDVLIEHFKLERKHPFFKPTLKTRPLRGVYVNKHIPNLIVIDKHNGGKADALNLGINVAKNDYVCGIDADSILDEDALLKLMSITLDQTKPYIAIGGNIVPVNGCVVDKGKIDHTGLGKKTLVRFQTLEYLRAFTTGRIGWSKIKSLLIISGAFGLFQRKSLLDTGGYLTISGDLKKDTVGEDMELVVRLTYQALKQKHPYLVGYVHHANCYTELPSDRISLLKQRNRWQRGLLDILSYHRKLLFNPKYKQPGLIAFPYFFMFEMVGPFLEMIGYFALIAGLVLGLLNTPLVILLFVTTILYGMIISLFALWISERKNPFYSTKETLILLCYAIIENFGYRQWMSLHRVKSSFSALRESGQWGSQKRQGFQPTKK